MIKYTRQGNGLKDFVDQVSFVDTNQYSKDYFRVMDFPTRLYLGKNAFRISGNNETLVRGSRIYIDVVDANGNIIYHEILNVKNKDLSRTVVVYVYGDIPPGEATVYISGRIGTDPRTGRKLPYSESPVDRNFKDVPNIMWIGKLAVVVSKQNTSEVFFTKEPSISYAERLVSFAVVSGSTDRTITSTGSNNTTVSLNSRTLPAQYGNESVFETEIKDSPNKFRGIPDVVNNTGESKEALAIPEYTPLTTIKTNIPFFTKDMEGGTITVNNITVGSIIPKDAPAGAFSNIPAYSASIVRVLNETSVEVNKPFTSKISYTAIGGESRQVILNQFVEQTDFSVVYYDTSAVISKTMASESYVSMEFRDMEPAAGTVDKIRVSYKPAAGFGSFIDVGEFKIAEQNILIDSASFELTRDRGLVERRIGFVRSTEDVNTYWGTGSVGITGIELFKTDEHVMDGFRIIHSGSTPGSQSYSTRINPLTWRWFGSTFTPPFGLGPVVGGTGLQNYLFTQSIVTEIGQQYRMYFTMSLSSSGAPQVPMTASFLVNDVVVFTTQSKYPDINFKKSSSIFIGTGGVDIVKFNGVLNAVGIPPTSNSTIRLTNLTIPGVITAYSRNPGASYLKVYQKRDLIETVENTEYKLKFKSFSDEDPSGIRAWSEPYIDVYISGSGIVTDKINRGRIETPPLHDYRLGTFIGTVSSKMGKAQTNEMFFITKDRKKISPVFVVRAGLWDIGQIEIIPRKETGFSPNHVKLNIPLNRFEQSSELIIDVDYLNSDGVAANLDSRLYGVFFTGGQSEMSQSLVVVNREFLSTSSSMSERITGTISGSDIRFYDAISGSTAGTLSRLEITAKTRDGCIRVWWTNWIGGKHSFACWGTVYCPWC
jgi:hypothetical protein